MDFPPVFDNICTAMSGMCEKRRGFTLHAGVLFASEPVWQYRCMNLPKTDDNDRTHIEMMQTPYIDIWSMLLSGQVPYRMSNSSHLFGSLESNPALVHTLSYRRKITYRLLLIGFFHKLISMQDTGHNMLHLYVAQQLPSLFMHQWQWVISTANDNDAELNRQFPFGIDLNKTLPPVLLKLRTKAEKPDIQFSQHA